MLETAYVAVFLIGLLGGAHCVGMCGGIVGALTMQTGVPVNMPGYSKRQWPIHLAYNLGRISTYSVLGAILGGVGSFGMLYDEMLPVQMALYVFANLMLVALGLYLIGVTRVLAPFERFGQALWRHVQPLTRRFLPATSIKQALPLGFLWGFLPCGLVYGVLTTALMTGSALRGAMIMLAFGLGTLPNLLLAGLVLKRFRDFFRSGAVRLVAGLLVLGFGVFGLFYAPRLGGMLWSGVIC